ncbi:DltB-like membrane protein [Leptospira ryugenii]|uniref:DltB-like membrane protein n=1 Tax=Leptospira ryugenii TaxID=1917863 RepID=A0A2P2DYX8_9LEPT|nr:MBOAT family O-acyltransferase [Leptospira ryugenii]GBF49832.1 DltB-like membrane protein [Leptospira ryugenii]
MLFNSVHYLLFAPIVIITYFLIPKRMQGILLFIVSLYFYAIFKLPFLILLVFSFVSTKLAVDQMVRATTKLYKTLWLSVAIWANLGLLFIFKYLDFSIQTINLLLGREICDPQAIPLVGLVLPMGISFFTLQAISYAIDVHRGIVQPAKSIFHFGLFLSFFPQLVAGPILRASDVLHQFLEPKEFEWENLHKGIRQFLWGVFKKTFVADPLTLAVDPAFADPHSYSGIALLSAGTLFCIQIYCDFSGYSDIAIGTGRILGFHIPKNFDRPFLSGTLTELWRRWHISFSSWLRDYVYISLGGNRKGELIAFINLFVTTFVSGIWHGADWTYVLWGATHASMMVVEKFVFKFQKARNAWDSVPKILQPIYPCAIFVLSIFFFRARPTETIPYGIQVSFVIFERMFTFAKGLSLDFTFEMGLAVFLLFFVDIVQNKKEDAFDFFMKRPFILYSISAIMLVTAFLIYSVAVSSPFVYFQF